MLLTLCRKSQLEEQINKSQDAISQSVRVIWRWRMYYFVTSCQPMSFNHFSDRWAFEDISRSLVWHPKARSRCSSTHTHTETFNWECTHFQWICNPVYTKGHCQIAIKILISASTDQKWNWKEKHRNGKQLSFMCTSSHPSQNFTELPRLWQEQNMDHITYYSSSIHTGTHIHAAKSILREYQRQELGLAYFLEMRGGGVGRAEKQTSSMKKYCHSIKE